MTTTGIAKDVQEALNIGQFLHSQGLIEHVTKDHNFENKYLFYRLLDYKGRSSLVIIWLFSSFRYSVPFHVYIEVGLTAGSLSLEPKNEVSHSGFMSHPVRGDEIAVDDMQVWRLLPPLRGISATGFHFCSPLLLSDFLYFLRYRKIRLRIGITVSSPRAGART